MDIRKLSDNFAKLVGILFCALAVLLLLAMVGALFLRSLPILQQVSSDAFFSSQWHPKNGEFGIFPFVIGTLATTLLAMAIAVPICILASIYLSDYAPPFVRNKAGLLIEVLAGVPSVIFGLWGVIAIVPLVREIIGPAFGAQTSGFSILSAAIVLAIMVTPIIISLSVEVLRSVPRALKEASMGLGATRAQTILSVSLPTSANGLAAAVVLGFSRAIGETMAVMMVVGNVPGYPKSIFDPAYPLTALIANNYGEMMSIPLYDSVLMLAALLLLVVVLAFNLLARAVLLRFHAGEAHMQVHKTLRVR